MDREIVERAALIAHLDLTEEELDRYEKDLTEILDYFQMLDEIPGEDTLGFNPIIVADAFREDVPKTEIDPDLLTKDMKTYEDYIRGPKLS
jgi:aspartyl-tRNA(Asn)/glutamyl-tRNA(Gln) amidotransferase subunit C